RRRVLDTGVLLNLTHCDSITSRGLLAGKTAQPIGENLKSRLRRTDVTRLDASQTIECCLGSQLLEEIFWQVLQQLWVPRDARQLKVVPAVAMSDFMTQSFI